MRLTFEDGEREAFLTRLGLPSDANDETLVERVSAWIAEDPNQNQNNNGGIEGQNSNLDGDPSGDYVVVDVASFARMRQSEITAAAVVEANRVRDRDELIEEAIHDGKFGPSRRQHYKDRFDTDPEGTKSLIARLMKNTVPLEARGADAPTDEVEDDSYPQSWVPEVSARSGENLGGQPTQVMTRRSRVHSES